MFGDNSLKKVLHLTGTTASKAVDEPRVWRLSTSVNAETK